MNYNLETEKLVKDEVKRKCKKKLFQREYKNIPWREAINPSVSVVSKSDSIRRGAAVSALLELSPTSLPTGKPLTSRVAWVPALVFVSSVGLVWSGGHAMDQLPLEVLSHILCFLQSSVQRLLRMRLVSKKWRTAVMKTPICFDPRRALSKRSLRRFAAVLPGMTSLHYTFEYAYERTPPGFMVLFRSAEQQWLLSFCISLILMTIFYVT